MLHYFHFFLLQAGRLLANLIVMGSGIIGRAVFQAYRQALASKFHHFSILLSFRHQAIAL